MELTPEHQQRIVEEERIRIAEERYRAKVRQELSAEPRPDGSGPKRKYGFRTVLFVAGMLILGVVAIGIVRDGQSSRSVGGETIQSSNAIEKSTKSTVSEVLATQEIPAPQELSTGRIAELATRSVVVVESFDEEGQKTGHGSGYVYSADGTVITNYHVIRGASSLTIRVRSSDTKQVESVLGYDPEKDVAALKISPDVVPPLETDDSESVHVGDRVIAIGAPLGLESTVSEGIISALRGAHTLQTTASISPGSSGGPLLSRYGKVIGLTTATLLNGQALNFVVSSKYVTELLSRKEEISISQMLTQTRTVEPLASNTFMVGARARMPLQFLVRGQQGALLEGSYTVSGGSGNDIGVSLIDIQQQKLLINSGKVSGSGQMRLRLPKGNYAVVFDNSFSTFTSKSVSPDLNLLSYK